jgi:hypothetical protein
MGATMAMPVPARSNFAMGAFPPAAITPPAGQSNADAAHYALNLSPQEQALYNRHLTNLNGPGGVDNPDGSRSTLYQAIQEHGGRFYSVPTVWDGRREVEPYTRQDGSTMDVPNPAALANVARPAGTRSPLMQRPRKPIPAMVKCTIIWIAIPPIT